MLSIIVFAIIMIGACLGMLYTVKKQSDNPKAKPILVGLFMVVIISAITLLYLFYFSGETGDKYHDYNLKYAKAAAYVLAKELATQMPGARVLVVVEDEKMDDETTMTYAHIQGLKEGFGDAITDVKYEAPQLRVPEDPEFAVLAKFHELFTAQDLNKILNKHKDRNLIVSVVGLPQINTSEVSLWKKFEKNPASCPKLALIGEELPVIAPFVNADLIPAAVVFGNIFEDTSYQEPPESLQECFDINYVLITKKNIKEELEKNKKYFR